MSKASRSKGSDRPLETLFVPDFEDEDYRCQHKRHNVSGNDRNILDDEAIPQPQNNANTKNNQHTPRKVMG